MSTPTPIASAASGMLERGRETGVEELRRRAEWIRLKTIELVDIAGSGHYSSTFSAAELFAVLYYRALRLDPANPANPDRDRFLLGKGHAAVGLYPCLADLGFFPAEILDDYTRLGSPLGDHPDMRKVPGVDFSSGSIGHNLSVGAGMALAARKQGRDYRTVVMLGDGELNEGQVWEAAMAAAHFKLGNLVAIVDLNGYSLDGPVSEVMGIEPVAAKWEAFGWTTREIDGHDVAAVVRALDELPPTESETPFCLLARTQKGKGVPFMESSPDWHLGYLGEKDRALAVAAIEERLR
jgi:transketolase